MYSLLRNEGLRKELAGQAKTLLTTQAASLLPALAIAQLYYHWKSFLLEFVGFLATWFVIDLVLTTLLGLWRRSSAPSSSIEPASTACSISPCCGTRRFRSSPPMPAIRPASPSSRRCASTSGCGCSAKTDRSR